MSPFGEKRIILAISLRQSEVGFFIGAGRLGQAQPGCLGDEFASPEGIHPCAKAGKHSFLFAAAAVPANAGLAAFRTSLNNLA